MLGPVPEIGDANGCKGERVTPFNIYLIDAPENVLGYRVDGAMPSATGEGLIGLFG